MRRDLLFRSYTEIQPAPVRRRLRRLWSPSQEEIVRQALNHFPGEAQAAFQAGSIEYSDTAGFSGTGWKALPRTIRLRLSSWSIAFRQKVEQYQRIRDDKDLGDYEDYALGIVGGWVVGLLFGVVMDQLGFSGIAWIEGITRLLAGSGDTLGGLGVVLIARMRGYKSKATTFAIGTVIGTLAGPLLQLFTNLAGVNPYGIGGTFYAIAYSNADNWGGIIAAGIQLLRKHTFIVAAKKFITHPFFMANLVVLIALAGLALAARSVFAFAPTTNLLAAVEGAVLNNDSTLAAITLWVIDAFYRLPLARTLTVLK